MVKVFMLDTNVLLFDPEAIFKLEDNHIILPSVVIEEIDHFKNEKSERGQNSRRISRHLDALAEQGSLADGVSLGEGKGMIAVVFGKKETAPFEAPLDITADNFILTVANGVQAPKNIAKALKKAKATNGKGKIHPILISKDVNLRVKANVLGIEAQDYRNDKVLRSKDSSYKGRMRALCLAKDIRSFRDKGVLAPENLLDDVGEPLVYDFTPNEFVEIYSADTNSESATLGRFDAKTQTIVPLRYDQAAPKGIKPRNIGQAFALEALLQPPEVAPLVIIQGSAGTGKTFLSLAAGLYSYSANKKHFNRILICRPATTMDENLGFLPGSEQEKIAPYMRAIKDNLLSLNNDERSMSHKEFKDAMDEIDRMFEDEYIKAESLAYQRGRSLNNYWFILDEMQNSTIRQAKSIVTRCGKGTKIILMGDPAQIDSPYLDSYSNGLTYAAEKMKGSPLCWQVSMKESECVRSALAQDASERM